MAMPIAPTPILYGEDAKRLERIMAESDHKKERLVPVPIDMEKLDRAIKEMVVRHRAYYERKAREKSL